MKKAEADPVMQRRWLPDALAVLALSASLLTGAATALAGSLALVTNQSDETVSFVTLPDLKVTGTVKVGGKPAG
ncbi:MAG: hypothetical protein R3287_02475, partial [Anderseniella sp.]|nr:hypothetical protein [Anderseniella sp.]